MPNQEFYKNGKFPTLWDYRDVMDEEGLAFVDEIPHKSTFLLDAYTVESNNDFTHDYKRRVEIKNTAHDASLDEGFYGEGGERYEEKKASTYKISDSRSFEDKQKIPSKDNGIKRKAENIQQMMGGMVELTTDRIINGGGINTVIGKAGPGLFSYLDEFQNIAEMQRRWEEGKVTPFTSENSLAIDNQDAVKKRFTAKQLDYKAVENDKQEDVWTSIIGCDWGVGKMGLLYPKAIGNAGVTMKYHNDEVIWYEDPHDGIRKRRYQDHIDAEKYYGWFIQNRFAMVGLRNIYLGHDTDEALEAELTMVERNLIKLAAWHKKGLGGTITFYGNEQLVMLIAQMHQDRLMRTTSTPTQNDGSLGEMLVDQVAIAPGIVLKADYAIKSSEKFVG